MPLTQDALALSDSANHPLVEHSRAVAELAVEVSAELGMSATDRYDVELTALFHDIGKLGLMDELLDKPQGLTAAELDLVREHPVRGEAVLERAGGRLARVARIVRSCHERWDGKGYPDGLAGEEIPVGARIVFCCDAYDAMTSDRPYSTPLSHTRAIAELWSCSGTQFDPAVVAAVVRAAPRVRAAAGGGEDGSQVARDGVELGAFGSAGATSG